MKLISVCGARPNFIKIAALLRELADYPEIESILVHTGQHYDTAMSHQFFDELNIPEPDVNLEVGSCSHAVQTARIMERFEPIVLQHAPDAVLVVGDVNSTMACALVAVKLGIPVIHVEAGLRSFDRDMPEEINRVVTDALSDLLFVTERSAVENLEGEGVSPAKIHFVGNVMIDTLRAHQQLADRSDVVARLELHPRDYVVLTLHRPSNVDDPAALARLCAALREIQRSHTVVFPTHPRTRANLQRRAASTLFADMPRLRLIEPLGYLEFIKLMRDSAAVLTDSGGIQEETTVLGVPCLTLRENTERPVTISEGTNRLVGTDPRHIVANFREIVSQPTQPRTPEYWDGHAAQRIVRVIADWHRLRSRAPLTCESGVAARPA
ncbi:MAG: UDP-2,3-diacetamido-2,3-dideoxy-D-glucuronate 2-epimerase [Phycisphaerae bacterium]|nr:UDP-2,3-diacetamido-2,3-dideoxy-D-glucuronate 2-epimerase [Phycisphaerae bacterium]